MHALSPHVNKVNERQGRVRTDVRKQSEMRNIAERSFLCAREVWSSIRAVSRNTGLTPVSGRYGLLPLMTTGHIKTMETKIMQNNFESRTEAASRARVKMEEVIQANLSQTHRVVESVQNTVIQDRVVKGAKLDFAIDNAVILDEIIAKNQTEKRPNIKLHTPDGLSFNLHENAMNQVADRANVPMKFVSELLGKGAWGADLLAENFKRIYQHGNGNRYLVRSVGDEARGFLSDKYRRLDVRPLLDTFMGECQAIGAMPVQGFATDTRVGIRAILPVVFEPVDGECIVFGVNWQNSDFGKGANSLSLFHMRLWCLNGATLDEVLRQVHLGSRLDDNLEFSERTIELDTMASISKLKDVIRYAFGESNVELTLNAIKTAHEDKIDPKQARELLKARLNKGEVEAAIEAYNSPDVVMLPAGNTKYRLSNAISWISQAEGVTTDRRLELDRFAGELIGKVTKANAVEV